MFGKPKDDLQDELERYDKGEKNDVFEDYNDSAMPSQQNYANISHQSFYTNSQLMQGEQVIWQGKSGGKDPGTAFMKFFGFFWLGFSILWTFLASMGSLLFAAFGIPFIVIGVMLVSGKMKVEKYYIITNKRIIERSKGSRSISFSQITDLSFDIQQNGTGYIIYQCTDGRSNGIIYDVTNVEQVYNAMCQAIREVQG